MANRPPAASEYLEKVFPLPHFNRQGLEVGAAANATTAWRCQVCQLDFQGPEFFRW